MGIRKATLADHPAMVKVGSRAFTEKDPFHHFMNPYRREYPDDYKSKRERGLWVGAFNPAREYMVSIDEETGEVVSWCSWLRLGPGAAKRSNPLSMRIWKLYVERVNQLYIWLWPDRSGDPAHDALFREAQHLVAHYWSGTRAETWLLDVLCTDPDHEGKGHGKALVNWGIALAKEEGVCNSLIAATDKEGYYAKFGFVEVGKGSVGPLAHMSGGAIMFRENPVPP